MFESGTGTGSSETVAWVVVELDVAFVVAVVEAAFLVGPVFASGDVSSSELWAPVLAAAGEASARKNSAAAVGAENSTRRE